MPKVIEKDGKKTTVFDVTDPKDMEIAEKLAKAQLVANEGGQSKEQFEKEAEIEAKLSKAEDAQQVFDELKSKVENEYIEKGLQMPNITDKDSMASAIKNLNAIEKLEENQQRGGSGYAPLSPEQIHGGIAPKQGFESHEQMIDHLRDMEKVGTDAEKAYAKEVIQKLTYNSLKKLKEEGKPIVYEDKDFEILKKITANKRRRELIKRQKGDWEGEN
jgi:hypothetical protein